MMRDTTARRSLRVVMLVKVPAIGCGMTGRSGTLGREIWQVGALMP